MRSDVQAELDDAGRAEAAGNLDGAWRHLERAHILSQPFAGPHVRVHIAMLVLGWRQRDAREIVGQFVRMVVAAPGSWLSRYPRGNTGRARVSMTRPMTIPADLEQLLTRTE